MVLGFHLCYGDQPTASCAEQRSLPPLRLSVRRIGRASAFPDRPLAVGCPLPTGAPMRPLTSLALVMLLGTSCRPSCDTTTLLQSLRAGLSPREASASLVANCKLEPELASWLSQPQDPPPPAVWAAVCPDGPPPPGDLDARPLLAERTAVYEACNLSDLDLGSAHDFVTASGPATLAIVATHALSQRDDVSRAEAAEIGRTLLGSAAFSIPDLPLAELPLAGASPPGPLGGSLSASRVTIGDTSFDPSALVLSPPAGASGHRVHEKLGLPAHLEGPLALAPDTPMGLLHRIASTYANEGTFSVVVMATEDGRADRPHPLPIAVPDAPPTVGIHPAHRGFVVRVADAPLPAQTGCPTPGPTTCPELGDPLDAAIALASTQGDGPVGLDLGPTLPAQRWLLAAHKLLDAGRQPALDPSFAPCVEPPTGMVCVPGGYQRVGSPEAHPGDGPALVSLSTFYLDAQEATGAQALACIEDGGCNKIYDAPSDEAPVHRTSYLHAEVYCAHQGKRPPTEWQWERAADLAPEGLRGMFEAPAEFTSTLALRPREICGSECQGRDPLGYLAAASLSKNRPGRVVRGLPDKGLHGRRTGPNFTATAGLGIRCASAAPILSTFPPAWTQQLPPPPPSPPALTEDQRQTMRGIAEDNIDTIPICDDGRRGSSRTDCKDPTHYIYPNEDRAHITYPYLQHRGGALIGVGSDQNYTFAGIARSSLVFLLDYDIVVVNIHRINQAFILRSETPQDFVAYWDPANRERAEQAIEEEWKDHADLPRLLRARRSFNRPMHRHYTSIMEPHPKGAPGWLRDPELFTWIRDLWRAGRVVSLKGDLMGPHAMQGAAKAAEALNTPVRIFYTSNAPNAWGSELTEGYRHNVRALPMDEHSVVLQALGWTNEFGQTGHWHYNVQNGPELQDRMGHEGYGFLWQIVRPYRNTDDIDLSLTSLPGTWEDAHR
ncbi:MAG: hypothetical protein EA397_08545 [Deltaproteobacteria bacterium]|nr:MAG: hypothetical protein EA397_08545 [Deltaproteobacteria bacterium]